ncbi:MULTISPECIES: helix-turn-helix domain-containing protein [Streptomyces]|uniref:DNA-binding protein n=2 Tax=Streptomyces TaxID=1883 RepID=A0A100Y634_9ACTN|nr:MULTISPECIES: helix-turn-helix transcriptional regulator [Streptomyces]KUH38369.1 DNA-binding protein [Streptomyces kanasensis]UUS30814.1 helix-turn-helix domain-containing protein [Streptomyces changanensis]
MPTRRHPYPEWALARRALLGRRIAALRRASGMSQDTLAAAAYVDRRSIMRWESGTRDPRYLDLVLLAHALGVDVSDLVTVEDPQAG